MSVKRLSLIYFYMLQIIDFSVVFLFWNRLSDITASCYAATRSWRFSPLNFIRSTNVCLTTKLSSEENPAYCQMCCNVVGFLFCQASLTKLSSSFTLKLISAFNALKTLNTVSIVALLALLSSLEI
jgi:hypothetical protein